MGLGLAPRPPFSPGNAGPSYSSRPGSRASPIAQGQGRPSSRPPSHEVPIIREANPNQGPGSALDFSTQGVKSVSPFQGQGQPRRPSSTLSEPGSTSHRALSPHLPGGLQPHLLIGKWTEEHEQTVFKQYIYTRNLLKKRYCINPNSLLFSTRTTLKIMQL